MANEVFYGEHQTGEVSSIGGNPATVNDATAKAPLGSLLRYKGNVYRYVKFVDGQGEVAAVAYGVVYWYTGSPNPTTPAFTVTTDYTDSAANKNGVAGILGAVITDTYYCYIQVGGRCTALTAASTVAGDHCIGSTTDKVFGRTAEGTASTDVCFATALDTRNTTTGTATVLLRNLIW